MRHEPVPMRPAKRQLLVFLVLLCALILGAPPDAGAADSLNLDQYRGKVVLVDFWASWCAPCRQSFPWLNQLHAKYGEHGLVIVGVNVDRAREDASRFLRDTPANFPILYDPEGTLAARYDVPGMPSSYLFGPDGELIAQHIGFRMADRDSREAQLRALLPSLRH
jgi:thiol-disulfide isomerase/thioredoxin